MKRLNVKLVLILIASVVGVSIAAWLLNGWQVARNARSLVGRADKARDDGDLEDAIHLRTRYLSHRPGDHEQRAELARNCMEKTKLPGAEVEDYQMALAVFEETLWKNRGNKVLRREFIDFCMSFRNFKTAAQHLEILMEDDKEGAGDPELQILRAFCLTRLGKHRDAAALCRAMIGYDEKKKQFDSEKATAADEVRAYELLTNLYRESLFQNDHADRVAKQLVEVNEDSYKAHLARASYLLKYQNATEQGQKEARSAVFRALELAPDQAAPILLAAAVLTSGKDKDTDQAAKLLHRGVKNHPDDAQMYLSLAKLAILLNNTEDVTAHIKRGLEQIPESRELLRMQALLQVEKGEFKAARQTVKQLATLRHPRHRLDYLEARIKFREGRWLEAARELEAVRPMMLASANDPQRIDAYLGKCYEQLGQSDRALAAYVRVTNAQPGDLAAYYGKYRALSALGRLREAAETLERIKQMIPAGTVQQEETPELLERVLRSNIVEQRRLSEDRQDWAEVDDALAKIERFPDFPAVRGVIMRTEVLVAKGQVSEALDFATQALSEHRDDQSLSLLVVGLTETVQGTDEALDMLDRVTEQFGDSAILRLRRASAIVRRGGAGVKAAILRLERDIDEFSNADKDRLWRGLSTYHWRLRDFSNAQRLLGLAAEANPQDLRIRTTRFDVAHQAGDEAGMSQALADIEKLTGKDDATWQLAEATRLVWLIRNEKAGKKSLPQVHRLLNSVREKRADWHKLSRLEAEVLFMQNDVEPAIKKLQSSLEQGPAETHIVRQLAQRLLARGRVAEAKTTLLYLDASQQSFVEDLWAQVLMLEGNPGDALQAAKRAAEESVRYQDHLRYGELLIRNGLIDEGEKAVRRAVELSPRSETARLGIVKLLVAVGKRQEAEKEIQRARLVLREDRIPIVMGQGYELLGDFEQARRYYLMALDAAPDDLSMFRRMAGLYISAQNQPEAEKYLRRILQDAKPNDTTIHPNVAWARQVTARLLAQSGDYAKYLQAQKLLDANVPQGGKMSREDLLLKVTLAASRPDSLSRQGAINLLNHTAKERRLTDPLRLVLARLYDREGKWKQCKQIMIELATSTSNQTVQTVYIEMLLRHREYDEALRWIKSLPTNSPERKRFEMHVTAQRGEDDAIIKKLLPVVAKARGTEKEASMLLAVAKQLEELAGYNESEKLYDEAERLLRLLVEMAPDQELVLAGFLGRRGRFEEAFELCSEAMKGQVNMSALQVGMAILTQHRDKLSGGSKYHDLVKKWFDAALAKSPDSKMLQLSLAMLEELRGNMSEVEKIYREYLDRKDVPKQDRAIIQNNLAFLLAMQGHGDEAIALIQSAVEFLGPTADLLDTRSMAYLAQSDVARARADIHQALGVIESESKLFHLALIHQADRNPAAARDTFEKAKQLGLSLGGLSPLEQKKYRALVTYIESANLTSASTRK